MPAIVTNQNRVAATDYYAYQLKRTPTYVVIGGTSDWPDEPTPLSVRDCTKDRIEAYQEIVAAKKIEASDITSVVRRIDWVSGEVYDEYNDVADLINDINQETLEFYNFYVLTNEFNVYKCISNNNREPSTVMPSGTSINTFETPDGYVWKYMYSLKSEDIFGVLTQNWMPCYDVRYNDSSSQWQVQDAAVGLSIEHIVVTNNGANYSTIDPPIVTITGDGSSATATAIINNTTGEITNIIVTNRGSGYTTASVSVTGTTGVGAQATAIISPVNGHGYNARHELGAVYLMVKVDIEGDEGGLIPTNLEYRKINLISEILDTNTTGSILACDSVDGFIESEEIEQSSSSATATIHSINRVKGYLYVKNITGTFTNNESITSDSGAITTVLGVQTSQNLPHTASVVAAGDIVEYSGDLFYIANREKVIRNDIQNESIRLIIAF